MNDAELVQDLRDDADRLERELCGHYQQEVIKIRLRLAADRIEATAGVAEACEAAIEIATRHITSVGYSEAEVRRHLTELATVAAAIAKAKGDA